MIKIFSHWIPSTSIFQIVLDLLLPIVCVALAVYWMGHDGKDNFVAVVNYSFVFAFTMIILNSWLGLYRRSHVRSVRQTRTRALLSLFLSIPLALGVFTLRSNAEVHQQLLLLAGIAALLGTATLRVFMIYSRAGAMTRCRMLIFGTGAEASMVAAVLTKSDPDIHIVGFYPSPTDTQTAVPSKLVLPRTQSLSDTANAANVDEIIIAVPERRGGILPLRELLDCKLSGVNVLDPASYFERTLGQIRLDSLRAGWLIFSEGFRQGWRRTAVKRLFDIIAAVILLLLALPIMALTAIAIALESGFPIFYRQERVGLNGRLYNVVKFRSMRIDAEKDGKPRWASANDDRTTRVGRIIRKLRIDELPQLFSVLAGEMSLVGPRPERPYFVDQLTHSIPFYAVRHSVKPGVTGWAQVNYHYGASVDDSIQKLQYDLYYVKNHTLFLDIVILFETVGVVLSCRGAH